VKLGLVMNIKYEIGMLILGNIQVIDGFGKIVLM
jgi:hypothetical protein